MSAEIEIKPVFVNEPAAVVIPRITTWLRFKSWAWNLARRPLVRIRQRELVRIAEDLKADLVRDLLPKLYKNRTTCSECLDAYLAMGGASTPPSQRHQQIHKHALILI